VYVKVTDAVCRPLSIEASDAGSTLIVTGVLDVPAIGNILSHGAEVVAVQLSAAPVSLTKADLLSAELAEFTVASTSKIEDDEVKVSADAVVV
jgi:hypothetical protein